ncbi:MAG: hypothetical protein QM733_19470 [Ilumatobacteraceae bacterium]
MLAVVEDEQHAASPDRRDDRLSQRPTVGRRDTERRRGDRVDIVVTLGGNERDEPDLSIPFRAQLPRGCERDSRLADPAHPGQRHEPRAGACGDDFADETLAADEG